MEFQGRLAELLDAARINFDLDGLRATRSVLSGSEFSSLLRDLVNRTHNDPDAVRALIVLLQDLRFRFAIRLSAGKNSASKCMLLLWAVALRSWLARYSQRPRRCSLSCRSRSCQWVSAFMRRGAVHGMPCAWLW